MLRTHSTLQNWSVNRPHLQNAAQLLASLYPGLQTIRVKESDFHNRVRIRITVKARPYSHGQMISGTITAGHLDIAISRIIQRIDSQPELRKIAVS